MSHFGESGKLWGEVCCGGAQILPQSEEGFEFRSVIFIPCLWVVTLLIVIPRLPWEFFISWTASYCWYVYRCDMGISLLPSSRPHGGGHQVLNFWSPDEHRGMADIKLILWRSRMCTGNWETWKSTTGTQGRQVGTEQGEQCLVLSLYYIFAIYNYVFSMSWFFTGASHICLASRNKIWALM